MAINALDHTLDSPSELIQVYGLLNRIRLTCSDSVVKAAEGSVAAIVEQFFQPNMPIEGTLRATATRNADPLRGFSEACRHELRELLRMA